MVNGAPESKGRLSGHFFVKVVIFSILVFAGVTGGVYVGTAISNRPAPFETTPEVLSNTSYVKIGDTFPDYELTEFKSNATVSISSLTNQGPALLIFASTTCDACHHLAKFASEKLVNKLKNDIQIALIFDTVELTNLEDFPDSLVIPGARVFMTERSNQRLEDGINVMPSVFGLDRKGKVRFAMSGYNRRISADFINEFI